jgi:large subunit ribosomal protein L4e
LEVSKKEKTFSDLSRKLSVKILDLEGKESETTTLPDVFLLPIREEIVARAFVALDSHRRQPQGRDPLAGERTTAETYNPPTGRGISRIPRVKGDRYSKSGMAGGVASIVHGRLPFPPRSEKVIRKEINRKERRLALACAIAATGDRDLVANRGHIFSAELPIVVSDEIEKVTKVRELKKFLGTIGSDKEIDRLGSRKRKLNSALSKLRRRGSGPLFVVGNSSLLKPALKSIPGVSVVKSSDLSVLDLAPGSIPGRLTIWTKSALETLPKRVIEIGERYAS